jgi:DNA-directed RNA polymerase specialized sigma24 family protein
MESIVLQKNYGLSSCSAVERSRLIQLLHASLSDLEPAQKLALELRFWEEMNIEQIATIMKTTWNEVDELLERTFLELRKMLNQRLMTEAAALEAA